MPVIKLPLKLLHQVIQSIEDYIKGPSSSLEITNFHELWQYDSSIVLGRLRYIRSPGWEEFYLCLIDLHTLRLLQIVSIPRAFVTNIRSECLFEGEIKRYVVLSNGDMFELLGWGRGNTLRLVSGYDVYQTWDSPWEHTIC